MRYSYPSWKDSLILLWRHVLQYHIFGYITWLILHFCSLVCVRVNKKFYRMSLISICLKCLANILFCPIKNIFATSSFIKYRLPGTLGRTLSFHINNTFLNAPLELCYLFLTFLKKPFLLRLRYVFYHITFLIYSMRWYSIFVILYMIVESFAML